MHDLTAKRTLVKSPPELWSELSEVERLARHLGAFGEIEITKVEPEHTVAWEGEGASGTVSIEPAGWGTKVTLNAQLEGGEPEVVVEAAPEGPPPVPVEARPRRRILAWLFRPRTQAMEPPEEPPVAEPPEPAAEVLEGPAALAPEQAQAILDEALDALGAAHHRPFSRG